MTALFFNKWEASNLHIVVIGATLKCVCAGIHTMYNKNSEHTEWQEQIRNMIFTP